MSNPRNDCDFCRLDANADQRVILRNDTVLFLQNEKAQGALLGSGVIIPARHAETVFDLTPEEVDATFVLLKHVKSWMDEHYHPDGYNVGWNCWTVGGQITMHAHMHVMPRFRQEPYAGRGIRYWLKQPANRWWSCLVALLFLCAQGLSQAGRYVRADFCDLTPALRALAMPRPSRAPDSGPWRAACRLARSCATTSRW